MNLKQLRQDKADNDRAQAALKAEGMAILAVARDSRTAEQVARLTAIDAEMVTLTAQAKAITEDLARAEQWADDQKAKGTPHIQLGQNRADAAPVSFGEFLQGVAYAGAPQLAAAHGYQFTPAVQAAVTGASAGDASTGGALVRTEWTTALLDRTREESQLYRRTTQIPVGEGFDSVEAPFVNETSRATGSRHGGIQVYRAAEAASVTAANVTLGKFELRLEDLKGLSYATDRSLRDAASLQSMTENAFSSEFSFKIDDEIVRGTGAGQSLGILNAGNRVQVSKESGQANDTVKAENVLKMFARMPAKFIGGAEWFINQEILPQLFSMSIAVGTAGGQLIYMPPGGLSSAPYGTLMGRPVNPIEQAAGLGDEGDIMFLNLKEYITIAKALQSASSMHVRFIYDEMTFRWTWPVIGKPKSPSALTPYKATSATSLSPFVTLQAR